MAKLTFVGGIHPYDGKDLSKDKPIQDVLPKGEMVYPLSQHIGAPAKPRLVTASAANCYFRGEGESATLKVPIYEEELKYFYSNYKDYYYLPTEDVALHKSVAGFVDKEHRLQASAANCYTRKFSCYLPQWEILFTPFFKRDYKSKELFFELTDEMKKNREGFTQYANHVLSMIASTY